MQVPNLCNSPLDLVFIAVRLPLVVGAHLAEGQFEGGREGNDDGAGVVLVHVLLDLEQPEKKSQNARWFGKTPKIKYIVDTNALYNAVKILVLRRLRAGRT